MKNSRPGLVGAFTDSTVDFLSVAAWYRTQPDCHQLIRHIPAYKEHLTELTKRTNEFETQLKRYLIGVYPKTLHRLFAEIRAFHAVDNDAAPQLIGLSLNVLQTTFLLNEWYEIMPRFTYARKRIERLFGIEAYEDSILLLCD